jgi:hypothetical protein
VFVADCASLHAKLQAIKHVDSLQWVGDARLGTKSQENWNSLTDPQQYFDQQSIGRAEKEGPQHIYMVWTSNMACFGKCSRHLEHETAEHASKKRSRNCCCCCCPRHASGKLLLLLPCNVIVQRVMQQQSTAGGSEDLLVDAAFICLAGALEVASVLVTPITLSLQRS